MIKHLEWHKACLRNMQQYLEREQEALARQSARVSGLQIDISYYKYQIERAIKKKRVSFDSEKYGKLKKKVQP